MKLVVFGSTGSVGIHIVKNALAKGHSVTAFCRSADKLLALNQKNLNIFEGDITDSQRVASAIKDQDAVLCAIGDGRAGKVRAIGTKHIIDAMKKADVKRLICQTTLGLGSSKGNLNFVWKYVMFGFLLKKAFKDHQVQEQYLFDSDRDYTIVRPSAFIDGEITKQYITGFDGSYKKLSLKITRADVADFMVDQLTSHKGIKKAISISN